MSVSRRRMLRGLVAAALAMGLWSCGDEGKDESSSIHAVASILQVEGQTGPEAQVRLMVLVETDGGFEFVEEVENPTVDYDGNPSPSGPLRLSSQRVRLAAPEGGGAAVETTFFQLFSINEQDLEYRPGTFYQISFTVNDARAGEFAGKRSTMFIVTPEVSNEISKASEEAVDKKLELVSASNFPAGILEVKRPDSGDTTFVSFPYKEAFMSGPEELVEAVGALSEASGTLLTVPPEAFRREGTHAISYFGLASEVGASDNLAGVGGRSAIFAGQAATLNVDVR